VPKVVEQESHYMLALKDLKKVEHFAIHHAKKTILELQIFVGKTVLQIFAMMAPIVENQHHTVAEVARPRNVLTVKNGELFGIPNVVKVITMLAVAFVLQIA
jgi:hypothetical protein